MEEDQANSRSGEMRNFGLLLLVLLVVVLVVAFSRPFIFGKVIPAILGGSVSVAPLDSEKEVMDEGVGETAVDEPSSDTEAIEAAYPAPEAAYSAPTEAYPAPEEEISTEGAAEIEISPINPEELPASIPTIEHVVQAGDTLTSLANRFNTSIDEIVEANGLSNPNQLTVGSTLLIPQPEE